MQGIRGALIGDLLRCGLVLSLRSRPIPSRHLPPLLPSSGSLPLGVTGGVAVAHDRQRGRSLWMTAERWRRPWVQEDLNHHTSKLCPFLCLFSQRLSIHVFFCTAWRPLTTCTPFRCTLFTEVDVDRVVRSLVCFPCLHPFLIKMEASVPGMRLGASWSAALVCLSSSVWRFPPQQSPESSIWPHKGTTCGGGVRSVASQASSIELIFAFPRLR